MTERGFHPFAVLHLLRKTILRTPLLWLAGCSVLVVRGPGVQLFLPGVDALQAQALAAVLMEETP